MQVSVIDRRLSPLCYLPNGKLVCYRDGRILVYEGDAEECSFPIPVSTKERLLGKCRITYRFFRLGIRSAVALNDKTIIIALGDCLYEVDVQNGRVSEGHQLEAHVRPLFFSTVQRIEGFEDGIYFGSYIGDLAKIAMHIYKRVGEDRWEAVYTFPKCSINHVHNIIPDPYRNCLWVMTGDFDDAAALWKAEKGFEHVERVLCGNQRYRGCVGFALPEGLLYATDSPFQDNYIQLLKPDMTIQTLSNLDGSCIYGTKWGEDYVFESSVEPDGIYKNMLDVAFHWKKGSGIKNRYTHLYVGNLENGFKEVYKLKKDWWPFIFRFAAFIFPSGDTKGSAQYFQPIATSRNDLSLMKLSQ